MCNKSWIVTKFPRLFDIFSPSTWRWPLCIQTLAITSCPKASSSARSRSRDAETRDRCRRHECQKSRQDISRSSPSTRCASRAGRAPTGCPSLAHSRLEGFHSTKSIGLSLIGRDLDPGARDHVVERTPRQLPVSGHRAAHRTAHVLPRHRRGAWRSALDDRDHRADMIRRARLEWSAARQPSAFASA